MPDRTHDSFIVLGAHSRTNRNMLPTAAGLFVDDAKILTVVSVWIQSPGVFDSCFAKHVLRSFVGRCAKFPYHSNE